MAYTNKIVVIIGQSNAVGRVDAANLPAGYSGYIYHSKIYDDNNPDRYAICNISLNNNQFDDPTTDYGIEPFFKNYFSSERDLYLAKCTKGATYLANTGTAGCWAQGVSGGMFSVLQNTVISRTNSFMSGRGKAYSYPVVIWIQGEADSTVQAYANAYETNLNTFIGQVNTVLGTTPLWIIAKLSSNTTDPALVYKNTIRTAQANVVAADPTNRVLINTDDLTFQPDGVHYDATGMQTLADRIITQVRTRITS